MAAPGRFFVRRYLAGMRVEIRHAYRANPEVLGIFPVAAYNGGPRNVMKLTAS